MLSFLESCSAILVCNLLTNVAAAIVMGDPCARFPLTRVLEWRFQSSLNHELGNPKISCYAFLFICYRPASRDGSENYFEWNNSSNFPLQSLGIPGMPHLLLACFQGRFPLETVFDRETHGGGICAYAKQSKAILKPMIFIIYIYIHIIHYLYVFVIQYLIQK